MHTSAGQIRVGDSVAATLIVTGYPAEVGMSWLDPLLSWPGRLDVAIHIDPLPMPVAADRLRKQRARLESVRRMNAERGRLEDPLIDATAADAGDLADLVARGDAKLFEVGIYLTVHARTRAELAEALADVRACAASVLLDTHPATWRQLQGWTSTLPLGHDALRMHRIMDSDALAASFPLACPDLPGPLPGEAPPAGGVLYGVSESGSVVWWDRWACDNHNSVVLARSGSGKSYLVKLEVLRNLYDRVQVAVIDPEDEYVALAEDIAGTVIRLGAPGVRLNPFDVPGGDTYPGALERRVQFLHTLIAVMLGGPLPPMERAVLDAAIISTYEAAGITGDDPATWHRPAPLLGDLAATLTRTGAGPGGGGHDSQHRNSRTPAGLDPGHGGGPGGRDGGQDGGPGGHDGGPGGGQVGAGTGAGPLPGGADVAALMLGARLAPWVNGSFSGMFNGPSTVRPGGHLVVWSTRRLPEELRAAGMLLALDSIWRDIDTPRPVTARDHSELANQAARLANRLTGRPASAHASPAFTSSSSQQWSHNGSRARPGPTTGTGVLGRRLVVVDEAWALMREAEGARFLAQVAKSARKRRAGLAVVTQDAGDLLGSDLGQVVVANSATQILMRQAPQAIRDIATTFDLTAGEARQLLSAQRGQALLLSGPHRVLFDVIASDAEHALAAGWADLPDPPDQYPTSPGTDRSTHPFAGYASPEPGAPARTDPTTTPPGGEPDGD